MQRKSSKPQPRPVTAWSGWSRVGKNVWLTCCDGLSLSPEKITGDKSADECGAVRVRVTPIRKPTERELEALSKKLWRTMPKGAGWTPWEQVDIKTRSLVRCLVIAAWERGAR